VSIAEKQTASFKKAGFLACFFYLPTCIYLVTTYNQTNPFKQVINLVLSATIIALIIVTLKLQPNVPGEQ